MLLAVVTAVLCVALVVLWAAWPRSEQFSEPGALRRLALMHLDTVAWLRIRDHVPSWQDTSRHDPQDNRLPLVMALVQKVYASVPKERLAPDADLFILSKDNVPDDFSGPLLAFCHDHRSPSPRVTPVPDVYTDGWPDARMASVFDLPSTVADAPLFERRRDALMWIGNPDTHPTRAALVDRYRGSQDIVITPVEWGPYGPGGSPGPRPFMSMRDLCEFKYLLDVQGNGWSARLKHLLCLGSVVFVMDRRWHEYWFNELVPWVHYVPVREDGSDLETALARVRDDPALAKRIARDGREKALRLFSRDAVYGYYADAIRKYVATNGLVKDA